MFPFMESAKRKKELEQNGIYIGAVHNSDGLKRLAICFLRGLMVFLACYSAVTGLVDAFDIPYNRLIVTIFILVISLFSSFLYYNKAIFYIGYIFLLVGFTYELVNYYLYANSGYQAVVNIIFEEYSDYFNLLTLREAHEFITDRYTTVTIAMIFVGALLSILLNITISGYMNLFETILITFPFLEIAFYIDKRPPLYCVIMLVAVYICVGLQQASRNFKMTVKGKHTPEYLRLRRKKSTTYVYQSTAAGTLQTLLFSLILSALIGVGFYGSYYSAVPLQPTNEIKKTTDEYVKIFIQNGFTGLLDRYDSTGGLNQGRLGGVSSIRPDFETDLTVTFAPYSYETVYLKSFTGSYYTSNQWSEHTYVGTYPEALKLLSEEDYVSYADSTISTANIVYMTKEEIAEFDAQYQPHSASTGKMEIINMDTAATIHLPYFSSSENCTINYGPGYGIFQNDIQISEEGTVSVSGIVPTTSTPALTITYSPYLGHYDESVDAYELPLNYDLYVNEFCLQIPEELKPVLSEYCAEQDFPGIASSSFSEAPQNAEEINAYRLEVAQAIYEHYVADFDYTMSPGTTPYRQDFVEYFLTTQKRGVCAHFAASGTMLLRSMGVPARYVEGYCIPLSVMSDGQPINENYADWYQGPTQVSEEGVLTVDVTDAQAHAWVEIYLEGYGFVPFEMTPPDFMEDSPMNFNFGNLFDGLFTMEAPDQTIINNSGEDIEFEREGLSLLSFSFGTSFTPVLIMLGVVLLAALLIVAAKMLWAYYKRQKLLKKENYAELMYQDYAILCNKIKARKAFENPNPLPDELCKHLLDVLAPLDLSSQQTAEINDMFTTFEKALYAPRRMTSEEYHRFQGLLKNSYQLLKTKPTKAS